MKHRVNSLISLLAFLSKLTVHREHVLVLAVERNLVDPFPRPGQLIYWPDAFRESKNRLVGGIAVDLLLLEGKMRCGDVELRGVAESSDGLELQDGGRWGFTTWNGVLIVANAKVRDVHLVLFGVSVLYHGRHCAEFHTLVRVPVLSEHNKETDPRVSTVARDLQRMLLCFIL